MSQDINKGNCGNVSPSYSTDKVDVKHEQKDKLPKTGTGDMFVSDIKVEAGSEPRGIQVCHVKNKPGIDKMMFAGRRLKEIKTELNETKVKEIKTGQNNTRVNLKAYNSISGTPTTARLSIGKKIAKNNLESDCETQEGQIHIGKTKQGVIKQKVCKDVKLLEPINVPISTGSATAAPCKMGASPNLMDLPVSLEKLQQTLVWKNLQERQQLQQPLSRLPQLRKLKQQVGNRQTGRQNEQKLIKGIEKPFQAKANPLQTQLKDKNDQYRDGKPKWIDRIKAVLERRQPLQYSGGHNLTREQWVERIRQMLKNGSPQRGQEQLRSLQRRRRFAEQVLNRYKQQHMHRGQGQEPTRCRNTLSDKKPSVIPNQKAARQEATSEGRSEVLDHDTKRKDSQVISGQSQTTKPEATNTGEKQNSLQGLIDRGLCTLFKSCRQSHPADKQRDSKQMETKLIDSTPHPAPVKNKDQSGSVFHRLNKLRETRYTSGSPTKRKEMFKTYNNAAFVDGPTSPRHREKSTDKKASNVRNSVKLCTEVSADSRQCGATELGLPGTPSQEECYITALGCTGQQSHQPHHPILSRRNTPNSNKITKPQSKSSGQSPTVECGEKQPRATKEVGVRNKDEVYKNKVTERTKNLAAIRRNAERLLEYMYMRSMEGDGNGVKIDALEKQNKQSREPAAETHNSAQTLNQTNTEISHRNLSPKKEQNKSETKNLQIRHSKHFLHQPVDSTRQNQSCNKTFGYTNAHKEREAITVKPLKRRISAIDISDEEDQCSKHCSSSKRKKNAVLASSPTLSRIASGDCTVISGSEGTGSNKALTPDLQRFCAGNSSTILAARSSTTSPTIAFAPPHTQRIPVCDTQVKRNNGISAENQASVLSTVRGKQSPGITNTGSGVCSKSSSDQISPNTASSGPLPRRSPSVWCRRLGRYIQSSKEIFPQKTGTTASGKLSVFGMQHGWQPSDSSNTGNLPAENQQSATTPAGISVSACSSSKYSRRPPFSVSSTTTSQSFNQHLSNSSFSSPRPSHQHMRHSAGAMLSTFEAQSKQSASTFTRPSTVQSNQLATTFTKSSTVQSKQSASTVAKSSTVQSKQSASTLRSTSTPSSTYRSETKNSNQSQPTPSRSIEKVGHPKSNTSEAVDIAASSDDEDGGCTVCFERPVNAALISCGHLCMCYECAQSVKDRKRLCPLCRQPIKDVLRVYKS